MNEIEMEKKIEANKEEIEKLRAQISRERKNIIQLLQGVEFESSVGDPNGLRGDD